KSEKASLEMRLLVLVAAAAAAAAVLADIRPNPKALKLAALADDADGWAVEEGKTQKQKIQLEGRPCMTVDRLRKADNETQYYECAPLSREEMKEFALAEKDRYLGTWVLRGCPGNHTFEEERQKCRDARIMRRMPMGCDRDPLQIGCGVPCPASNSLPTVGGNCDWLSAPLIADPLSNAFFLYCAQQTGQTCGEWTRIPCSPGTVFDATTLICAPAGIVQRDSPCGGSDRPICQCAQTVQGACPGTSQCMQNVCCISIYAPVVVPAPAPIGYQPSLPPITAPLYPPITNPIYPPITSPTFNGPYNQGLVTCPGTFTAPLSSSCDGCSGSCVPNVGCCGSNSIVGQGTYPQMNTFCPNTFTPPIGQCSSCPQNTQCVPSLNSCCPSSPITTSNPNTAVILICPTGQPASSACGMNGACPQGTGCYQGGCCPMTCPAGQQLIGFCANNGCGSGNCYKESGTCCQAAESVTLPICQNGVPSMVRCTVDQECGLNQRCSNGGCCPMPFCPSGVQLAVRPRRSAAQASSAWMGPAARCRDAPRICPSGFACLNGACCALPTCPSNGLTAISSCNSARCGSGFECVSGGCCPLPQCPTGALANQRCQLGSGCPSGNVCENGVCCPLPVCSIGIVATGACGMANSCPMGFVCEGRGCCPEPMPLCPNGGRANMRCTRGTECPPGYGCTPLGGCCLLSMDPTCPAQSSAVCQCSGNNVCPQGASCNMGTCCSTAAAPFMQVPGSQCVASPQCNGFSNGNSQCVQGVCVCLSAGSSNGVSCVQMTPVQLVQARTGCDQFGSPCRFVLSTARRRPIFAPTGNTTAEPLFYNVAERRRCVLNATGIVSDPDATCLPNEKCIEGECRQKLWPGEYGCQVDEECSSRCPNTYCEKRKTDKKVPQCQCRDGLLLHGRCFSKCPTGFHESGAHCVHDNEDTFWKSADAQDKLKDLLNNGQC
ncbi:hypothetical protein PRIPAC_71434, partial [Pristionchus pacificus]|uniref:Uncharacterized protein n=1 Tax=Pristionchus pacificus TaxID=54126 RepID=A0A2A6BF99_PRIPA